MAYDGEVTTVFSFGPRMDDLRSRRRAVGVRFERKELEELGIAMLFITIAFAVVFSNNQVLGRDHDLFRFLAVLPASFIATFTGFALHELGHKISANHYGYPAAFSYNRRSLIFLSIFSVLTGFLLVAPGAVYIYGRPNRKENGVISAAGPVTNLVIGYSFMGLFLFVSLMSDLLGSAAFIVGMVNLFIGSFNMIPIMPLDGSKIWKWNKFVYLLMLVLLLSPVILLYTGLIWYLI
ncbi:MAG: hypothetical protein JXA22_00795 [Candidatus Thermoplasmatota archaeon]|nr:hypothetical protein [Candidatus Thermoplasmatota archaeon]